MPSELMLYHGTSESVAHRAVAEGLLPRSETGHKGHWGGTVSSSIETVHLTNAYPLHFAAVAVGDDDDRWAVLEVPLAALPLLVPDEDFMEQVTRGHVTGEPVDDLVGMKARTVWYRNNIENFAHHFDISLRHLGTCAHIGAVPASAIMRVALIRWEKAWFRWINDAQISLMNYKICGDKYRALTDWIFGADATVELATRVAGFYGQTNPHELMKKQVNEIHEYMQCRSAITLVDAAEWAESQHTLETHP